MGPPWGIDRTTHHTMSNHFTYDLPLVECPLIVWIVTDQYDLLHCRFGGIVNDQYDLLHCRFGGIVNDQYDLLHCRFGGIVNDQYDLLDYMVLKSIINIWWPHNCK